MTSLRRILCCWSVVAFVVLAGSAGIAASAWAEEKDAADDAIEERNDIIGDLAIHYVREGDTMLDIAMHYRVGYVELLAANPGVESWAPREGTVIVLPERHILPADGGKGLLVNLGDLRLYYFPADGSSVRSWAISTGKEAYETPVGLVKVTGMDKNPTWVPTANYRKEHPEVPASVPPGPANPLGKRRIRIGYQAYAIHGTNKPEGLGRRVSSGCIRMYPKDVEDLYDMIKVGMPVTITNQPLKLGWSKGQLYIEVHPFGSEVDQIEFGENVLPQQIENIDELVFNAAGKHIGRVNWNSVYVAVEERRGIPVRITR